MEDAALVVGKRNERHPKIADREIPELIPKPSRGTATIGNGNNRSKVKKIRRILFKPEKHGIGACSSADYYNFFWLLHFTNACHILLCCFKYSSREVA